MTEMIDGLDRGIVDGDKQWTRLEGEHPALPNLPGILQLVRRLLVVEATPPWLRNRAAEGAQRNVRYPNAETL